MQNKKLVRQLKRQSEKALVLLVQRYSAYVSTVIRNVSLNAITESDVEEIAADVFITIWNNTDKLCADSLDAYLATIARNLTIDRLRRLHHSIPIDEIELDDNTDIERETEKKLLVEELAKALDEMEEENKEILLRFYFYYQHIPDIAKEMQLTESACKTRLHRARKKLKGKLTERGYDSET